MSDIQAHTQQLFISIHDLSFTIYKSIMFGNNIYIWIVIEVVMEVC